MSTDEYMVAWRAGVVGGGVPELYADNADWRKAYARGVAAAQQEADSYLTPAGGHPLPRDTWPSTEVLGLWGCGIPTPAGGYP